MTGVQTCALPILAAVDERDTTCCYARQDKFWVKGAPSGERWEIYTVLEDSATFWGQDGGQSWDAAKAALGPMPGGQAAAPAGQGSGCCSGQQAGGADDASGGVCCA